MEVRILSRKKLDIPEPLQDRVEAIFGDASNTIAGSYVAALWYACERYEAEHGRLDDSAIEQQSESD